MNKYMATVCNDDDYALCETAASTYADSYNELLIYIKHQNKGVEWSEDDDCYTYANGDEALFYDADNYCICKYTLERIS